MEQLYWVLFRRTSGFKFRPYAACTTSNIKIPIWLSRGSSSSFLSCLPTEQSSFYPTTFYQDERAQPGYFQSKKCIYQSPTPLPRHFFFFSFSLLSPFLYSKGSEQSRNNRRVWTYIFVRWGKSLETAGIHSARSQVIKLSETDPPQKKLNLYYSY